MGRTRLELTLFALVGAIATCSTSGCRERPAGVVLTYQIVVPTEREDLRVPGDEVVVAINRRLGRTGRARVAGDNMLEVDVFGRPDEAELEFIKRRISALGQLEFRILANPAFARDQPIIEVAEQLPAGEKDVVRDDEKVAQWVPYSEREFGPIEERHLGMVIRDAEGTPEALVLMDPWNVTGEYLKRASKGPDERGRPAIHFEFDRMGAERFRRLTSANRPSPATPDMYRNLGIIFDGELISAPRIMTTISDRGMISGGALTEADVELIIDILNAGSLPAAVRLVDERRVAE